MYQSVCKWIHLVLRARNLWRSTFLYSSTFFHVLVFRWYWEAQEDCHSFWTYTDATFFAFSLASTVGYGHVTTETDTGKVAVILYGMITIPIYLLAIDFLRYVAAYLDEGFFVCAYIYPSSPVQYR